MTDNDTNPKHIKNKQNMKKFLFASALMGCVMGASAQDIIERPKFGDNWQIGIDAGINTPLKGHSFFGNIRPTVGAHLGKQFNPIFGLGLESLFGINTSSQNGGRHSKTAFDNSYFGLYTTYNLTNAFMGYSCEPRKFSLDALLGMGWGHEFIAHNKSDNNHVDLKAGLNFNFAVSHNFGISLKPSVQWNIIGEDASNMSMGVERASFNLIVGLNFGLGKGFTCYNCPDRSDEISALNSRVNALRAEADGANAAVALANARNAELSAALAAANAKPAKVIKENTLSSVRYVFFKIGSSTITADQMPNVEMIAAYLKNHPGSKVIIRGYASPDGPIEVNERLAAARAESVKNSLIKKYRIDADRIDAGGEGIGTMFAEESWNRVSICTLEN